VPRHAPASARHRENCRQASRPAANIGHCPTSLIDLGRWRRRHRIAIARESNDVYQSYGWRTFVRTVDIREAKADLSRLVERAAKGEPFVIARAGKSLVMVVPFDQPNRADIRRTGFMAGQILVPDDFDRMGSDEIERAFSLDR
jgi:prevent-host-death family protein